MNREPLKAGTLLSFPDDRVQFEILRVKGKGSSCIVYEATRTNLSQGLISTQLLKEYYPRGRTIQRGNDNGLMVADKDKPFFQAGLERFRASYRVQVDLRQLTELLNVTSNIEKIYIGYGTEFIDMTYYKGLSYDKVEETSLVDLLRRMRSITEVIGAYHRNSWLHLDIKPDNIFVDVEKPELVQLFDFDSMIRKKDLQTSQKRPSYTEGWAPLELQQGNTKKICEATDIFSLGEILFFKLMNRHSDQPDEGSQTYLYSFDQAPLLQDTSVKFKQTLTTFFHQTLCSVNKRWKSTNQVIRALDELIAEANNPQPQSPPVIVVPPASPTADTAAIGKRISRTILVAASLICAAILVVAGTLFFTKHNDGNETNIVENNTVISTVVNPQNPAETNPNQEIAPTPVHSESAIPSPTQVPSSSVTESISGGQSTAPEETEPVEPTAPKTQYVVDTIAANVTSFRSLVINSGGVVYYINGDTVYTSDGGSLNLSEKFGWLSLRDFTYLAYDPYNDIVYLIVTGEIYDISNIEDCRLVMDWSATGGLTNNTSTPQPAIAVLPDGSLLLPIDLSSRPYRANIKNKTTTEFMGMSYRYDYNSSYSFILGDSIVTFYQDGPTAKVRPIAGGDGVEIQLEHNAPYHYLNTVATENYIWHYENGAGLGRFSIDGSYEIVIPQEQITALDYTSLDNTNIWALSVHESGVAAFYDNSLQLIRRITPAS